MAHRGWKARWRDLPLDMWTPSIRTYVITGHLRNALFYRHSARSGLASVRWVSIFSTFSTKLVLNWSNLVWLAGRGNVPLDRAVCAAVHVASLELAPDEQHAVGGPPVEVEERRGDRFALKNA